MISSQVCDRAIACTDIEHRAIFLQRRERFVPEPKYVAAVIVDKQVRQGRDISF